MSRNTGKAILEINSYINADYHAREQSRLLEMFDKVVIESTCAGHIEIEEWSNPDEGGRCRKFSRYRFVPGLKLTQIMECDSKNRLPEMQCTLDGKPVSMQELMSGYRGVGHLILLPAEQLYERAKERNIKELKFTPPHLYFSEFSVNNKRTGELERGLDELYDLYSMSIPLSLMKNQGLRFMKGQGFCFPSMSLLLYYELDRAIEHWPDESNSITRSNLSKDYGSVEKYLKEAIGRVIGLQKKSWGIWGEIGALCDYILNK